MNFDFEKAIARWRRGLAQRPGFLPEDLDELERHLRDHADEALRRGAAPEDAFRRAVSAVGDDYHAEAEYRKIYWTKLTRRRQVGEELLMHLSMLSNYLRTAYRSLMRKKGFSFINIAGLTLGLACCLVIFQYVAFERSYDRFHENADDLYRLVMQGADEAGAVRGGAFTSQAMGPAMAAAIPEIRQFARVGSDNAMVTDPETGDVFEEDAVIYVDRAFLEMFTFPLSAGSDDRALEPGSVLLSESTARRYFGAENAMGRVLQIQGQTPGAYRVAGVFRDVPPNSHLRFDMILPMEDLLKTDYYANEIEDGWSWNNFTTYVQLHAGADLAEVDRKLTDVLMVHRGEIMKERGRGDVWLSAQPLGEVYLNAAELGVFIGVGGDRQTVRFFSLIGLLTLVIALVNYVNLATARAMDRAREVGVRKVVGARRGQLVGQFLAESGLTIAVAATLAVGLSVILRPMVNDLAGTNLTPALWTTPGFWVAFAGVLVMCTLLAGLYPAFVLSSFRPVTVLKGKAGAVRAQLWLRKGLVVFQFAAAVVLIGGTAIVYSQLHYMRTMDLGLDMEQVLTVQGPRVLPEGMTGTQANQTMVQELRRMPAVSDVATSWRLPGEGFNWNGAAVWRAEQDELSAIDGRVSFVDTNFVSFYGLELIAGQGFGHITPASEIVEPFPYMITETTARALGFESPREALGQSLRLGSGIGYELEVVGVLRDFDWESAHHQRENVLFGFTWAGPRYSIRIAAHQLPATIAGVETLFADLFPGNVFHYGFADEAFAAQYENDRRFARLFSLFAGLAIFIASLGLFGLASFAAQQRTKEIGIRKVLGASVAGVAGRLSADFLRLVGVAFVLGIPVTVLVMQRWLENFAYRIDVGPGIFLLTGLVVSMIALLTVTGQALKAAMVDPARSLRTE
jgi:putative ABC transport system permease protein